MVRECFSYKDFVIALSIFDGPFLPMWCTAFQVFMSLIYESHA